MRAAIESDLKQALKAGEKRRVATLRLLLSAFQNERIHAGRELTDAEAEAVIRRARVRSSARESDGPLRRLPWPTSAS